MTSLLGNWKRRHQAPLSIVTRVCLVCNSPRAPARNGSPECREKPPSFTCCKKCLPSLRVRALLRAARTEQRRLGGTDQLSQREEGKREPSARLADLATDDEVSQVRGLREKVQKGCGAMALANGRHRPPSSGSLGVLSLVATPSRPPRLQTVLRNPTEPDPAGTQSTSVFNGSPTAWKDPRLCGVAGHATLPVPSGVFAVREQNNCPEGIQVQNPSRSAVPLCCKSCGGPPSSSGSSTGWCRKAVKDPLHGQLS